MMFGRDGTCSVSSDGSVVCLRLVINASCDNTYSVSAFMAFMQLQLDALCEEKKLYSTMFIYQTRIIMDFNFI